MTQLIGHIDPPESKNCLLYARVSSDRQVREGHSLEDQVNRLVKFARDKNWRILEIYKDGGKSGKSSSGRPEFTRMLDRCQNDSTVNAVLLEETDRFARNAQDHLAVKTLLKKHNVELIATEQPNFGDDPVGNFVDLVLAGANQLQREITGQKTKRTMIALAEKGYQPGVAVLGYQNSFKKGVAWSIDEERVYFIKEIFIRYLTGNYSVHRLEAELYAEGFRTRTGKRVSSSKIHEILTDVRYAGKVLYNNIMYDGKHPRVVSMKDIQSAKQMLGKKNRGADRSRKYKWLLAGLVFCQQCGSLMSGEKHVKQSGAVFNYYRCIGSKNHGKHCNQPYAPVNKVHQGLEKHIISMEFNDRFFSALRLELQRLIAEKDTSIPNRIKALSERKQSIERKMSNIEDQMIEKLVSQDRIEAKYIPLRDELKAVEADLEQLQRPSQNLDDEKVETIINFLKRLPELYQAFNSKEREKFLRWFVKKIWIKDRQIKSIDYTDGFDAIKSLDLVRIRNTWLPG